VALPEGGAAALIPAVAGATGRREISAAPAAGRGVPEAATWPPEAGPLVVI